MRCPHRNIVICSDYLGKVVRIVITDCCCRSPNNTHGFYVLSLQYIAIIKQTILNILLLHKIPLGFYWRALLLFFLISTHLLVLLFWQVCTQQRQTHLLLYSILVSSLWWCSTRADPITESMTLQSVVKSWLIGDGNQKKCWVSYISQDNIGSG